MEDLPKSESFLDRLIKEKNELGEKKAALGAFFGTEKFLRIDVTHQQLLQIQHDIMESYHRILRLRIKLLENQNN